jgi:5-formaminoimidazole-4-carboxamide-1-beta-D-ribofuranosyl 5'-monophosphate synthetase
LPQYHSLLKKKNLTEEELKKLGEIEHYLLGVNSKIMEIKGKLEQDLFGQSMDIYYKLKVQALAGDPSAKLKLEKMRDAFAEALKSGDLVNYN